MALSSTDSKISTKTGTSNVAVFYIGGPLGGQQHVHTVGGDAGQLPSRRDGHGGHYQLDQREGHTDVYEWHADADLADRTPSDGDAATRLLEDNGGATPVLDQDVTSSMTVASAEAPADSLSQRQTKGPKLAAAESDKNAAERDKAGQGRTEADKSTASDASTSPRTATDAKGTSKPAGSAAKS